MKPGYRPILVVEDDAFDAEMIEEALQDVGAANPVERVEDGADAETLWAAANCEEDWQAEQWGWEWTAEERRTKRLAEFTAAQRFARLVRKD